MIAVQKVIRKLVSDYEFVIIPGFGALLSHQIPAIYDHEAGTFTPPVKKLAFNEFLKLDDGLLANFISREEKVPHVDAVAHIKQYADVLRSSLESVGAARIDEIGEFRTNNEGKLVFEPNTENYFKDEWYGFGRIAAKTLERNVFEANAASDEKINDDAEIVTLSSAKQVKIHWFRWASAAVLATMMLLGSYFLYTSPNREYNRSTLNPLEYFNKHQDSATSKISKNDQPLTPVINETVVVNAEKEGDILELHDEVISAKHEISDVFLPDNILEKKYYLIAGTFNGEKQANVLMKTLQTKGYEGAFVIPASAKSKKVKVAVQGFDKEKDAYQASVKLKEIIGENGWVFEK